MFKLIKLRGGVIIRRQKRFILYFTIIIIVIISITEILVHTIIVNFKEEYGAVSYSRIMIPAGYDERSEEIYEKVLRESELRVEFLDEEGNKIPMDNTTRKEYYRINGRIDNLVDNMNIFGALFVIASAVAILQLASHRYNIIGNILLLLLGFFLAIHNTYLGLYGIIVIIYGLISVYIMHRSQYIGVKGNVITTFK
ncbi:hypothetical protein RJG79_09465 [Mycoplasmatota bacterium WC44]